MKRILLGFDGSEESKDALHLARALCKATGAKLSIVCVYEHEPLLEDLPQNERNRDEYFSRLFDQAARELSYGPFEECTGTGSAAAALHATARSIDPDLVVIGSGHLGRMGRIYPGSVGERLLSGAPCAIAVAPRGFARRSGERSGVLGVAYDGRDEARRALRSAEQLASDSGDSLRLIGVVPPSSGLRELFSEQLGEAEAKLGHAVEGSFVIEEGDPAEVLSEGGADLDLLVVGSRGYGPLRHILLGGVTWALIRNALCPVLVIPRGVREPEDGASEPEDGASGAATPAAI
jgi:nucleotide-binding universal stress UspA family protein